MSTLFRRAGSNIIPDSTFVSSATCATPFEAVSREALPDLLLPSALLRRSLDLRLPVLVEPSASLEDPLVSPLCRALPLRGEEGLVAVVDEEGEDRWLLPRRSEQHADHLELMEMEPALDPSAHPHSLR